MDCRERSDGEGVTAKLTMHRRMSQYAAVMAAFTDRAADSLAASMIFDTSP